MGKKKKETEELKDGMLIEIQTPEHVETIGQGSPPDGIVHVDGDKNETNKIKFGSIVKVSEESFENGIGEWDAKPYPIINIDLVKRWNLIYKIVNQ